MELARIPAAALTSDAIVHDRLATPPAAPSGRSGARDRRGGDRVACPNGAWTREPSSSRSSAARTSRAGSWVHEQYDSHVQANTVERPGHGAAVIRIKGTTKALVASTDGNQSVGLVDPWLGAALSVAEATRNVSITGARPLGVTNCLNYGDPTRPEAFWQLQEGVRGLGDACRALGLPVTGGNVSLYNESPGGAIAPTPEIGVVGLLDDVARLRGAGVRRGRRSRSSSSARRRRGSLGSAYAELAGVATEDGLPSLDLAREAAVQGFVRDAIARGLVASAQDVAAVGSPWPSPRGASGARRAGIGAALRLPIAGVAGRRAVRREPVAARRSPAGPRHAPALLLLARQHGLPVEELGAVGGDRLRHRAGRTRRDRRSRGARLADRRRRGRPGRRPAPRLGARPGRALGEDGPAASDCRRVADDVRRVRGRPAGRASGRRRPRSPPWACSRSSTAARNRPAWRSATAGELMLYKDLGMIASVLDERRLPSLRGNLAIAHCRYSTTGSTVWENAQPTFRLGPRRAVAVGHNGNLVNTRELLDAAPRRPGAAARLDRHGAPDRPAGRRAGGRHGRGAAARPAPRPRRVQPRRSSTSAG